MNKNTNKSLMVMNQRITVSICLFHGKWSVKAQENNVTEPVVLIPTGTKESAALVYKSIISRLIRSNIWQVVAASCNHLGVYTSFQWAGEFDLIFKRDL